MKFLRIMVGESGVFCFLVRIVSSGTTVFALAIKVSLGDMIILTPKFKHVLL